jgi:hypothetical protein
MMLHLTINCKDLDELKSAKATIDRLVEEMEDRRKVDAEVAKGILKGTAMKQIAEEMFKVMNPPLCKPDEVCTVPPEGWYCTRQKGHEGPCAAHPKQETIMSKPIHYAPYGPYANGKHQCGADGREGYTGLPRNVTCQKCKDLTPGLWPKNTRTRSQVLAQRDKPLGACCNNYADQMGCDCLETAQPDPVEQRHTFIPCRGCGRNPDRCDCGMYRG